MTDTLNRQLAAVMFTDMAGYTALMQKDEAAALRARKRHRGALETCVQSRSGEVLQYFGDGSLCVFSSSVEAVQAAIDIQRQLAGDPALRIGLHSGDIAYDAQGAYGDAVNIAAKLEAICPPGGVTLSHRVFEDIRRHPELATVPRGTVRLKNIEESVSTYALAVEGLALPAEHVDNDDAGSAPSLPPELVRRLDELGRRVDDPLERISTIPGRMPLVGRSSEVRALRQTLERAESGVGGTVFVRGPRGVGKTRLTQEAARYARSRGWSILTGRAHPSERLVPYSPFSDALMPVLRGLDTEALATLTPGSDAALCALFPALGPVPRASDVSWSGPGESRTRLYWQFASMLSTVASQRPLLVALEDLDFADQASIELLEFVARQSRSEPIVFIAEYTGADPERMRALRAVEQSLVADGCGMVIELHPLDEAETIRLIREALELDDSESGRLGEMLYGWSRGNPFFMTGTLRGLVESGALRMENGQWKVERLDSIELPHTVRDSVLVWMGQLSGSAVEVARYLAMLGREAEYELLQYVVPLDTPVISGALDELARHQLVAESENQWTLRYAFRSPVISEVLRAELPLARRRELHGNIADSLEGFYGETADEHADELAYHYGRAHPGQSGHKALHYLAIAGEAALKRYASREAATSLQEALDRSDAMPPNLRAATASGDAQRQRILEGLARARRRLGDVGASIAIWRRLMASAREANAAIETARLHREQGLTYLAGGMLEEAIEQFAAATEWASGAGKVPMVIRSQLALGQCYQAAGRVAEAQEAIQTSLTLAKEFGRPDLLGQVYRSMTQLKMWTGPVSEAREAAQKAIDLSRASGNRGVAFWSRWAMAALEGLVGNTEIMARHLDSAKEIAERAGSPLFYLATMELQLELHYARGEWTEGIELGHRAIEMARSTDGQMILPRLLVWVSLIHIGRGELEIADELTMEAWKVSGAEQADDISNFIDLHAVVPAHIGRAAYALTKEEWKEAIQIAEAGLRIADRSGYTVWSCHHIIPIIGEAAIHSRDLETASVMGRRMREEAERLNHPLGLAWASASDAVLTWLQGDPRVGAESLNEAAEKMESIPLVHDAARLRRQLAGRLAEIGDHDGAVRELTRSYRVFRRLGARPELEKAEAQFGELGVTVPEPR